MRRLLLMTLGLLCGCGASSGTVARALQGLDYDSGPRSMTRVQLRVRLLRDRRGTDEKKRAEALRLLRFMNEKGALM